MAFNLGKPTFIFPLWIPLGTLELLPTTEIPKIELGTIMTGENGREYIYTQLNIVAPGGSDVPATLAGEPSLVTEDGLTATFVSAGAYNALTILDTPLVAKGTTASFYCVMLLSLGGFSTTAPSRK